MLNLCAGIYHKNGFKGFFNGFSGTYYRETIGESKFFELKLTKIAFFIIIFIISII